MDCFPIKTFMAKGIRLSWYGCSLRMVFHYLSHYCLGSHTLLVISLGPAPKGPIFLAKLESTALAMEPLSVRVDLEYHGKLKFQKE